MANEELLQKTLKKRLQKILQAHMVDANEMKRANTLICNLEILEIEAIEDRSGLYIVFDNSVIKLDCGINLSLPIKFLDVGESGELKTRLRNHDRRSEWLKLSKGDIKYGIIYCNEQDRMWLEKILRDLLNPPCGER